jgi:hypothetical protein
MITITLQFTPDEARVWAYVLTQLSNDALSRMFRPRHWLALRSLGKGGFAPPPAPDHDQETAWRVLRMMQLAVTSPRLNTPNN